MNKNKRYKFLSFGLSILGSLLLTASVVYEASHILNTLGLTSILQELDISSSMKVLISLYMFLGFSGIALALIGTYLVLKEYNKMILISNFIGALSALITIAVPQIYGFKHLTITMIGTVVSAIFIAIGGLLGYSILHFTKHKGPILTSVEIATTAVFSAMYAIAILMVHVPSPTGGYTHIGDLVVFVAALLFGYRVGGLVGIMGAVVADLYTGYSRWYVSILAHGLEGLIGGLGRRRSLPLQVVSCVIGGFVMASVYFIINIFIKGFPLAIISFARDLFAQAGISIVIGISIANIIRKLLPQLK